MFHGVRKGGMPANKGEQATSRGVKEQDTTVFTRGLKSMPGQEL